jgi:hypothetical protein
MKEASGGLVISLYFYYFERAMSYLPYRMIDYDTNLNTNTQVKKNWTKSSSTRQHEYLRLTAFVNRSNEHRLD